MRSSIACARCRRSKVKCVNTGPNTTCKACESSNRECTYPQPVQSGAPRTSVAGMTINAIQSVGGTIGSAERNEAPKKPKPKKPAPSVSAAATTASMNTPKVWRECLESPALTQAVWKLIFDAFQLHHSPALPFLHPPTFLNRLRASATNSATSSTCSPPAPEKPHSPLLLLGMLALTARHVPALVTHHSPALSTSIAVSEFYASALKYRFKHDDEDGGLMVPSLEKVQALLMLNVHEYGMNRKTEGYMWLGMAIRMAGALGLSWVDDEAAPAPSSPEPGSDGPSSKRRKLGNGTSAKTSTAHTVEKEVRRRTFWSVFILDRAYSTGRYQPSMISAADASRVQLPCEERGFMFGTSLKSGFLHPEQLMGERRNGEAREVGGEERILAQIVRAMEISGQIQAWSNLPDGHPTSTCSAYHKLSNALEIFVETLPQQLEFSLDTLQVHTSTQSSSAYAVLHATLFLARITLERKFLPDLPLVSPSPMGPHDPPNQLTHEEAAFYAVSAERLQASARDLIALVSGLEEWNAGIENPLIVTCVYRAAEAGLYAYNFPWMDPRGYLTGNSITPSSSAMGTGEEARKALEFISKLKPRWICAEERFSQLMRLQHWFADQKERFVRHNPRGPEMAEHKFGLTVNVDERNRLWALLSPPTPKSALATLHNASPRGSSNAEVDALLLAASGTNHEPTPAGGADRWMAVNRLPAVAPAHLPPTQTHLTAQKQEEAGSYLDTLAVFAAQQGKIGNGATENHAKRPREKDEDVETADTVVQTEEVQQRQPLPPPSQPPQQGEERRWIDGNVDRKQEDSGWGAVGVGALEG